MPARFLMLASAALLAGCEQAPEPAPVANAAAAQADRAMIERIEILPPGQLRIVLFRAIRDARNACQGIAEHRRLADQNGRPAWSAQCDNRGGRYLLVLSPNGQMTVTSGAALGQP